MIEAKDLVRLKAKLFSKAKREVEDTPNYGREFVLECPVCRTRQTVTKKLIEECLAINPPEYAIQVFVSSCGGFGSISFHCTRCEANQGWSEAD